LAEKVTVHGPVRLGRRGVIVHGGAGGWRGSREDEVASAVLAGARAAVEAGLAPGSVVDAIAALEDSGVLNAGLGSVLTIDGRVEMDAGVMYGDGVAGGVAAVTYPRNPIRLADWVARNLFHVLIAGEAADRLAQRLGLPRHPGPSQRSLERWRRLRELLGKGQGPPWALSAARALGLLGGDTVGAALVYEGSTAAGASTGGIALKHPGRVGDSPIPGAGFYAEDGVGACSATGVGETIILGRPCLYALSLLRDGAGVGAAARAAVERHTRLYGADTLGIILVDSRGWAAAAMNTEAMPVAYAGERVEPTALILKRSTESRGKQ